MEPQDEKFMDTLKRTHYFVLESVKIYDKLRPADWLYQGYKTQFQEDALDYEIFTEAHETIRQCFDILGGDGRG